MTELVVISPFLSSKVINEESGIEYVVQERELSILVNQNMSVKSAYKSKIWSSLPLSVTTLLALFHFLTLKLDFQLREIELIGSKSGFDSNCYGSIQARITANFSEYTQKKSPSNVCLTKALYKTIPAMSSQHGSLRPNFFI